MNRKESEAAARAKQRDDAIEARRLAIIAAREAIAESQRLLEDIRQRHAATGTEPTEPTA